MKNDKTIKQQQPDNGSVKAEVLVTFAEIPGRSCQSGEIVVLPQADFDRYLKAGFVRKAK